MNMFDYVLKLYPVNKAIVTKTNDENIFMVVSFVGIKPYTSFVCTNGKVLLNYCPENGELNRYDFVEGEWEYYSWTFSKKDIFGSLIEESNFNELYGELKKAL